MTTVTTDARSTLHGDARLYERTNFDISGMFSPDGFPGLPIGHDPDNRNTGFVYDLSPSGQTGGHSLWFGATRSGKGVSGIIPALLTTQSSCLVVDPKGELAWITMPRRKALGHRTVLLDPWNEVNERYGEQVGVTETRISFNPLSSLDPNSKNFNDDVSAIADALVIVDPNDENSHWTAAAKVLIAGLIAACVELKPGTASLRDVREMIQLDDDELATRIIDIRNKLGEKSLGARKLRKFSKLVDESRAQAKSDNTPGLVASGGIQPEAGDKKTTAGKADVTREIGSIRSTAETQTDLLDSEMLLDSLETNSEPFNLEELVTGKVTLYLVLPPDRLKTHSRWLRLIITLALRMVARQRKPPTLPVMFFIDEMGTIGALRMIEDSYGLLAGLGVRISGYLQDLSQLQRDYPNSWETFISNSSVIGVLQCGDQTTARYISEYLGNATIEVNQGESLHIRPAQPPEQRNAAKGHLLRGAMTGAAGQMGGEVQQQHKQSLQREVWEPDLSFHPRPVLFPSEVRNSPADKLIVIVPGKYNLRLQRFVYYSDPVLSKWARHDPNKPAPVVLVPAAPPVQQAAASQPRQPQTVDEKLGAVVSDAGGKAMDWFSRKAKEKLGG